MELLGTISFFTHILNLGIILVGLFLGLVILIQRGKGGGLAGAFGGPGGSSAFGSKAGDAFTRFTLITAGVWLLLIMVQVRSAKADALEDVSGLGQNAEQVTK